MRVMTLCLSVVVIAFVGSCGLLEFDEYTAMSQASLMLERGEVENAVRKIESIIEHNPKFIDAYVTLANIYHYELRDDSKAIEAYKRGFQQEPDNYSLNLGMIYASWSAGNTNDTIHYYKRTAAVRPENRRFSFPRELVQQKANQMSDDQLLTFCSKFLEINPTDAILMERRSKILIQRKQYADAVKDLQTLLEYHPENALAHSNMATCMYNMGEYEKALMHFTMAKDAGVHIPEQFFDTIRRKMEP